VRAGQRGTGRQSQSKELRLKDQKGNTKGKTLGVWVAIAFVLALLFSNSAKQKEPLAQMPYSEFLEKVHGGKVASVTMEGKSNILGVGVDGSRFAVYAPNDPWLVSDLTKSKVRVVAKPEEESSFLAQMFLSWFPMLLLIGVWVYFMRQQSGGKGGSPFSFGKSKAKLLSEDDNPKTFADVAGCDEAKHELSELVDFLKDPTRFQKLGGRMPKGVLMAGNPGTGKTLLARAVAGEAKVPFFSISGSDFVEMFVGVGASRVRDMFETAKKHAPCILFIDEIDAVGRHRGAGHGGGNDEREQTLNQLLVEMDGFEGSAGIIVIAATNRPDVLDPALRRPGRFDREVNVGLPDIRGREQILAVHTRKVPVSSNVDLRVVARGTPGFSGADLANLVNEAALFATRRDKRFVEMEDFESAKDKVVMGPERDSAVMPLEELKNTAYHEAGHAVIARVIPGMDPVHKVTIIPRGRALGVTMQLPEKDRHSYTKDQLLNQIAMLYGGRLAEELFVGEMSTGASNDFQRATDIARRMVCEWGMSNLGVMVHSGDNSDLFSGRSMGERRQGAEGTLLRIDAEIDRILNEQYQRAKKLLEDNRDKVEAMTKALLEIETIEMDQIDDIMEGRDIRRYDERAQVATDRRLKFQPQEPKAPETAVPEGVSLDKPSGA
jgi:cell division protease FtsH